MLVGARHASPLPAARYAVAFCPDLIPKRIRIGVSIAAEGLSVVFPRARRKGEACFAPTNGQGVHASTHLRFYVLDCRLKRSGRGRERRISYLESCISRGEGAGGAYLVSRGDEGAELRKFEIRSTKYETNPKHEARMLQTCRRARDLGLRIWVIRPCFAFRVSDFVLAAAFPGLCEGRDTRYEIRRLGLVSCFGFRFSCLPGHARGRVEQKL